MESGYEEKRPFLINKLNIFKQAYKDFAKLEREIRLSFSKFVDAEDKDYQSAAEKLIDQATPTDAFNLIFLHKLKPKYRPPNLEDQDPPKENTKPKEETKVIPKMPEQAQVINQEKPIEVKAFTSDKYKEENKVEGVQKNPNTKELKIIITISNSEFYDKVTQVQKDSEGKAIKYDFDLIMKKALLYLKRFVNEGLAEKYYKINKAVGKTFLFEVFKAKPQYSVIIYIFILLTSSGSK